MGRESRGESIHQRETRLGGMRAGRTRGGIRTWVPARSREDASRASGKLSNSRTCELLAGCSTADRRDSQRDSTRGELRTCPRQPAGDRGLTSGHEREDKGVERARKSGRCQIRGCRDLGRAAYALPSRGMTRRSSRPLPPLVRGLLYKAGQPTRRIPCFLRGSPAHIARIGNTLGWRECEGSARRATVPRD